MRGNLLILICFLLILSCSEEDFPNGIYDYQVERLLSGPEGSKTWFQVINAEECPDSLQLVIDLVESTSDDSLDIAYINSRCPSSISSVNGRLSASKVSGGILFTDSLIFSNGNFWIVKQVTAKQLTVEVGDQSLQFVSE